MPEQSRYDEFFQLYEPLAERVEHFALYLVRNRELARELIAINHTTEMDDVLDDAPPAYGRREARTRPRRSGTCRPSLTGGPIASRHPEGYRHDVNAQHLHHGSGYGRLE